MGVLAFCMMAMSYFSAYEEECTEAITFVETHTEIRNDLTIALNGTENAVLAISIVLPEISQYSRFENFTQTRMMYITYIQFGQGNFSVGYFQMKPSFAQEIESAITKDKILFRRYKDLIILEKDECQKRYERLNRLDDLSWELRYLEAFYEIAEKKISQWFPSMESPINKLKYLSALYNGGLDLSYEEANKCLKRRQFPHFSRIQYNYSDCAIEFYYRIKKKWNE